MVLSIGFKVFRIWPKDEVLLVEICQNTKMHSLYCGHRW